MGDFKSTLDGLPFVVLGRTQVSQVIPQPQLNDDVEVSKNTIVDKNKVVDVYEVRSEEQTTFYYDQKGDGSIDGWRIVDAQNHLVASNILDPGGPYSAQTQRLNVGPFYYEPYSNGGSNLDVFVNPQILSETNIHDASWLATVDAQPGSASDAPLIFNLGGNGVVEIADKVYFYPSGAYCFPEMNREQAQVVRRADSCDPISPDAFMQSFVGMSREEFLKTKDEIVNMGKLTSQLHRQHPMGYESKFF